MTKPLYSFIFVNFRSAKFLSQSLSALFPALGDVTFEILILNNDSQEREAIEKLAQKKNAKPLHLSKNLGFGKANNLGSQKAQGEILFFLNPDTSFHSGDFLVFAKALERHPKGILGARLLTQEGKEEAWSSGRAPHLTSWVWHKISPITRKRVGESKSLAPREWVSGAALALRKETFHELGGFDERFFLYFEDVDLCLRARTKNFPVFFSPALTFIHARGMSHPSHTAMKEVYFKGQKLYFEKHGSPLEKFLIPILQPLYRFFFS